MSSGADAAEIRAQLTDARALCAALDLFPQGSRKATKAGRGGWLVRCPWCNRGSNTPPCSVGLGPDGTLRAKCFSCDAGGDALSLIAAARGLDLRADFRAILGEAARLAGVVLDLDRPSAPRPAPQPAPTLDYPDAAEVAALWAAAEPIEADPEEHPEADTTAARYLAGRAIDPGAVDLYQLARVLPVDARAPSWACWGGKSWASTHRLILPVFDHLGAMRSLHAWKINGPESDAPKRTKPANRRNGGLVLACSTARRMLATGKAPSWATEAAPFDIIITEGEPDFLTWAARISDANEAPPAVLGVGSGSWCEAIAARIPDGSRVILWTDDDAAGDRYAAEIKASLAGRAVTVLDFERGPRGQAA